MSKYTTILFDADATLFDFKLAEHDAVKDCLEFAGLPANDLVIEKYSEINDGYWKMLEKHEITKDELFCARWRSLIGYYGFDFDAQIIADLYPLKLAERAYVIDGAEDICKKLFGNYKLYIVTNGFAKVQHSRFDNSPLRKYFDDMFISEEVGAEKPSIEYFKAIASLIPNYDPKKTLIVGDSLSSDIKGGIAAKIDTCWYNPAGKQIPSDMSITYVIDRLSDLETILL